MSEDIITRQDQYFDAMSGGSSEIPEPITRKEKFYAKMAGDETIETPEPVTREEYWLHKIIEHGGGGGGTTTIEPLTVTENGSYSEAGKAYSPVKVNVPEPTGTVNINSNGDHNVKNYETAHVNVPNPSTGTLQINQNGTHNVTDYASAEVNVPNSYSASDEGKVVSNGALVAQTSQTIDTNGTYDTTLKNEVVVNVSGGGGLEYETGVWVPTSAVSYDTIPFNNQHDVLPAFAMIIATVDPFDIVADDTCIGYVYSNWRRALDVTVKAKTTTANYFGTVVDYYRAGSNTQITSTLTDTTARDTTTSDTTKTVPRYWLNEAYIKAPIIASNARWRPAYSYKWIAIWAPTA